MLHFARAAFVLAMLAGFLGPSNAEAQLEAHPASVNAWPVRAGERSPFPERVELMNAGTERISFLRFQDDCFNAFRIEDRWCSFGLQPGESCTLEIYFSPPQRRYYTCTLRVYTSNTPLLHVRISGRGT